LSCHGRSPGSHFRRPTTPNWTTGCWPGGSAAPTATRNATVTFSGSSRPVLEPDRCLSSNGCLPLQSIWSWRWWRTIAAVQRWRAARSCLRRPPTSSTPTPMGNVSSPRRGRPRSPRPRRVVSGWWERSRWAGFRRSRRSRRRSPSRPSRGRSACARGTALAGSRPWASRPRQRREALAMWPGTVLCPGS
jgi:hypothetical protein